MENENLIAIIGMSGRFPKADSIDELWKKVKGFKNEDEAEILNYFMIAELYSKGLYYCGIGISWGSPCDKETCEQYLQKFEKLREAYRSWCISQR